MTLKPVLLAALPAFCLAAAPAHALPSSVEALTDLRFDILVTGAQSFVFGPSIERVVNVSRYDPGFGRTASIVNESASNCDLSSLEEETVRCSIFADVDVKLSAAYGGIEAVAESGAVELSLVFAEQGSITVTLAEFFEETNLFNGGPPSPGGGAPTATTVAAITFPGIYSGLFFEGGEVELNRAGESATFDIQPGTYYFDYLGTRIHAYADQPQRPIPEPALFGLFGSSVIALGLERQRKRKNAKRP